MNQILERNVLIVDDSDLLLDRLKKSLMDSNLNLRIDMAGTCREATDLFLNCFYETIILDINLPDGSGISLLREIKRLHPSTKVIMFTNYATSEFNKSCMEFGADHFFSKTEMTGLLKAF